jgi:hypothetical protein
LSLTSAQGTLEGALACRSGGVLGFFAVQPQRKFLSFDRSEFLLILGGEPVILLGSSTVDLIEAIRALLAVAAYLLSMQQVRD